MYTISIVEAQDKKLSSPKHINEGCRHVLHPYSLQVGVFMSNRKTRKQKHTEYIEKYGDIPVDYKERLSYLYDKLKITDEQGFNILFKRDKMMETLEFYDTQIILFEIPEGSPRPRFRIINRSNLSNMAMSNPNFVHVYSLTGKEDNMFMRRLISQEDFTALDSMICTPCIVDISAFLKTPSSYNKEDTILAEIGLHRPIGKPDWDNLGKKYSDMFNANVWLDDTLVVDGSIHKYYSILPRVEIRLRYMNMVYNKHQYTSIINRTDYDEKYNLKYFGG